MYCLSVSNFFVLFLFPLEIMFESFNIPGLYIAVQVRICCFCPIVSVRGSLFSLHVSGFCNKGTSVGLRIVLGVSEMDMEGLKIKFLGLFDLWSMKVLCSYWGSISVSHSCRALNGGHFGYHDNSRLQMVHQFGHPLHRPLFLMR